MLKARIQHYCRENNLQLHPKAQGQNFLVSKQVIQEEVNHANLTRNDTVLDIGAGFGFLTELLAQKARFVYAIEKDTKITKILEHRLSSLLKKEKIKVINRDVMDISLPQATKIVSNPPYHIISPLIIKILTEVFTNPGFKYAIMILQEAYAQRLISHPGEENWGRLPAALSYFGSGEFIRKVSKHAFYPPPETSSAMVKLVPEETHYPISFPIYEQTTKLVFSYQRKKVRNAVKIILKNKERKWRPIVKKVEQKVGKWKRVQHLKKEDIFDIAEIFLAEKIIS